MKVPTLIQSRLMTDGDIGFVRELIEQNPSWSRYRLSRELAERWNWQNAKGKLKDIACRSLLRKLDKKGLIHLPAPRMLSPNRFRHMPIEPVEHDRTPITEPLANLQPLQLLDLSSEALKALFAWLLACYHYLSFTQPVGENMSYLVGDRNGRPLACLLFGSAAWSCAPRDRYIGWTAAQRQSKLHLVTNNHRFLILPWVEVFSLASHVLAIIARRLSQDWQMRYGHPILLMDNICRSALPWHLLQGGKLAAAGPDNGPHQKRLIPADRSGKGCLCLSSAQTSTEDAAAMNVSELLKQASRLDVHQVNFFPIIRAYMQRLALVELINHMVGGQMAVKPGLIVAGMIQDTLSGRTPLYHLERFFEDQDIEMMLGESVPISVFGDHNVGRVLDRIAEIGASKIFGEIARRAAVIFDLDTRCGHWDSTSVSLWGEYDQLFSEDSLKITYGYSKDHRPDLKQFMISMLCVEHNIPILGETHDGNSSDKTLNNKLLTRISKNLAQNGLGEGAFTYVADSAMVTKENLAFFDPIKDKAPLYFVTRLPHTYSQADQAIQEAISKDEWQPIGVLSRSSSSPNRPSASYKAFETTVEFYGRPFRALVIHSSAHDKRRQKRIDRLIADSRKDLMKLLAKRGNDSFFCQADAEAECAALRSFSTPFHGLEPRVEEQVGYTPGRPRKDGSRSIAKRRWQVFTDVIERAEAIEQKRTEAGCFILITNRPSEGPDA